MKNWKYIEGAKTGNICSGNKKQDWDVGGNIDWDVGNFNGQWYVTKNGQKLVGPFMSMKEAERYLDGHKWELQNKYGNSKIGNAFDFETQKLVDYKEAVKTAEDNLRKAEASKNIHKGERYWEEEYVAAKKDLERAKESLERWKRTIGNDTPLEYARRKPRVINEDKTGAEEFFKQLSDDVKEREEKDDADIEKVGNAKDKNGKELRVGDIVLVWTSAGERAGKVKAISGDRITVAIRNEGDWSTPGKLADKVSNSKTGNANLETSVEKGKLGLWNWYVHKDGTIVSGGTSSTEANAKEMARKALEKEKAGNKVGNATPNYRYKGFLITNPEGYEFVVFLQDGLHVGYRGTTSKAQAEDWCDWHDPKTGKSIGNSKTGNATWYEPRRMPFQPRSLQYAYEQAKKKGLSGQKLEAEMLRIAKTTPHDSAATESEMRKDVSEWVLSHGNPEDFVNNKQTGNSASDKLPTAMDYRKALDEIIEKKNLNPDEARRKYGQFTYAQWEKELGHKIGNEAPDDKFAYVMREFDEGKLKTPDGKVVTDPAQAKAIAYSESKKTENGLARARNAMNKGVTMWKGNDSAYIKEDGTVSYLENNSFETDKDKFESQESAIKELSKQGYVKK